MVSLRGKAAITGIGETKFVKHGERSIYELAAEAARNAMLDAGLLPRDLDGIITLGALSTTARLNNTLASYLGIQPTYSAEASVYGASGGYALKLAAEAIASGTARNILVVGADVNFLKKPSNEMCELADDYQKPFIGAGINQHYGMVATLYDHLYGDSSQERAKIAVMQRFNASYYENSLFGHKPLTIEDVLNAPMIVSPLTLYEIVAPCDGALAFVVSSAKDAKAITKTPVYIEGVGFYSSHMLMTDAELWRNGLVTPIHKSARIAFEMAGISVSDIDVCGLYDCYTIAVILTLEDMGFCKRGEGARFVAEHDLTFKGDLPVNTNGGQLSVGQPGDAGGMVNIIEVVRQLMGRCGERQVADAEIGVTNSNGGFFSNECTLVLRRGG